MNNTNLDNIELSDDLLMEAYEELTKTRQKALIKKALELNPDNIEAHIFQLKFHKDPFKRLSEVEKIIEHAMLIILYEDETLSSKENIGHFWGIWETRPYMRARFQKMQLLKDVGYLYETIFEAQTLMILSKNDNLGVRYHLMSLLA